MQRINAHLYALIAQACKTTGTYDPEITLPHFEEYLTIDEANTLQEFLGWCHRNKKAFGHGNYNERFAEWKKETAKAARKALTFAKRYGG